MLRFSLLEKAAHVLLAVVLPLALTSCESSHAGQCGEGPSTGGHEVPEAFKVEMGRSVGAFAFYYETRNAKDRVQVFYQGNELFDSGCVGESRKVQLSYGPGRDSHVEVKISPNCESGSLTSWLFEVGCPAPTARPTVQVQGSNPRR